MNLKPSPDDLAFRAELREFYVRIRLQISVSVWSGSGGWGVTTAWGAVGLAVRLSQEGKAKSCTTPWDVAERSMRTPPA